MDFNTVADILDYIVKAVPLASTQTAMVAAALAVVAAGLHAYARAQKAKAAAPVKLDLPPLPAAEAAAIVDVKAAAPEAPKAADVK